MKKDEKNQNKQIIGNEGYQILPAPNEPLINYRGLKFSTKTDSIIYKNQHYVNYYLKWINIQAFKLYYDKKYYTQCLYIKNINAINKREILIFSQCFKTNFASILPFLIDLSNYLKINIITYQYTNKEKEAMNYLDANLIYSYLNKLDFVKSIILLGLSTGNKINMNIVLSKTNLYPKTKLKAIILISPTWVYNLSDIKNIKQSSKIKADVDKFLKNVNLYDIPVFIIHGKKDNTVKYFLSMSFSQQIKKKLEWFPKNGKHLDLINAHRTKLLLKIKKFLKDNDLLIKIENDPFLLTTKKIKEFNESDRRFDERENEEIDENVPHFGNDKLINNKDDEYYGYYNTNDIMGKNKKNVNKNNNINNEGDIYTVCKPKIINNDNELKTNQTFQEINANIDETGSINQTFKNDDSFFQGNNNDMSLGGDNINDITINENNIDYEYDNVNDTVNKMDVSFLPGDIVPCLKKSNTDKSFFSKKNEGDVSFM